MALPDLTEGIQVVISQREAQDRFEREMIAAAMDHHNDYVVKKAEAMVVSRPVHTA